MNDALYCITRVCLLGCVSACFLAPCSNFISIDPACLLEQWAHDTITHHTSKRSIEVLMDEETSGTQDDV